LQVRQAKFWYGETIMRGSSKTAGVSVAMARSLIDIDAEFYSNLGLINCGCQYSYCCSIR
jgi:hypothetical protein